MAFSESEKRRRALKAYIDANGIKILPWATAAGVSEAAVRLFIKGRTESLNETTYRKLATAAEVTVAELLGEYTPPVELPLWGYAGAGEKVHTFEGGDHPALETVDAPPGMKNGAAVIVRGDSMLPRMRNGDVLFFEMQESPPQTLLSEECVVRLADGTMLVKSLARGTKRNRFHLVSINPKVAVMKDQAVAWASPIQWIRRRPPAR